MPWGSLWGSLWGGGASPGSGFAMNSVRAVGSRVARVSFTREPLFLSPIGRYDASNLQRWELVRQDTGRSLSMLGTRAVAGDVFSIEILLSEPFASSPLIVYELTANQVKSTTGLMIVDPLTIAFFGMPGIREVIERPRPLIDLFNPQTGRDALRGALQMGTGGDYLHEQGTSLLRKLVIRRILTAIDEFYHLSGQGYGAGLDAKRLFRPGDLVVLRTQLQNEIVQEAEIAAADVSLSQKPSGQLDVLVSLTLRTNQQLTIQVPFNPQAGFSG
jgi:hypothetical protein